MKYVIAASILVLVLAAGYLVISKPSAQQGTTPSEQATESATQTPTPVGDEAEPVEGQATTGEQDATGSALEDNGIGEGPVADTPTPTGPVREFTLDGFKYGYSVKEIHVKVGDTVTVHLTSSDGFHDWVVDEFNARTDRIQTGQTSEVTFVADKAGTFEYYCSVGNNRAMGMVGTLIVEA